MDDDDPIRIDGQETTIPVIREPMAVVNVGHGCRIGITVDD